MHSLKKYSCLLLLLFVGCNTVQPVETNQDLFGYYESSVFVEPGSLDGGTDILANGGHFNLILNSNFKFTAELFIPDSIYSNYEPGIHNFEGSYSIEDDTLNLQYNPLLSTICSGTKEKCN